jgi:acyl carrier protein
VCIEEHVRVIVAEYFSTNPAELADEVSFIVDLKADSLDIMDLVLTIEEVFGIKIPDARVGELTTVGQLIEFTRANRCG